MPAQPPSAAQVAEVIEDLLTIAKVAMPRDLFEIDPRVIKAQALAARFRGEVQMSAIALPRLVVVTGWTGEGKSTVADVSAADIGCTVASFDWLMLVGDKVVVEHQKPGLKELELCRVRSPNLWATGLYRKSWATLVANSQARGPSAHAVDGIRAYGDGDGGGH